LLRALVALASPVFEQSYQGILRGSLRDSSGNALSNVRQPELWAHHVAGQLRAHSPTERAVDVVMQ